MSDGTHHDTTNVNGVERVASLAIGTALLARGVIRRDANGAAGAFVGAALLLRGATGQCPLYRQLDVSTKGQNRPRRVKRGDVTSRAATVNARKAIRIERAVTIQRDRTELYTFWRNFEQLPQFMEHLVSVTVTSPTRSHWITKGPGGTNVEWDAEIVNDVPDSIIAWKSVGGSTVPNAGSVNFSDAPAGRGTIVKVVAEYEPPAGKLGMVAAALFGENPDRQVREDLRKFKQLMEAGALTTSARVVSDDLTRSFAER